jgi:hypothetical protein
MVYLQNKNHDILEDVGMENGWPILGHWTHFTAIWFVYICTFGIICMQLFGILFTILVY